MPSDQSHVTNRLAQFVAGSQWETVPPEVRREGVRGMRNFVGCALGGVQDEAMGIAVKVLTPFFGPPQGIVIGRGDRPDALNAAFLNAVSANALEYDDTHLETVMHPAAPVAPGLFALAGLRPVSGRELLQAFILGVEISCRVGLGVMPTHYRRGWHITATCGIFGAAAACARQSRRVTVRCRFTANGNAIRGRHKHAAHPVRSSDRVEGCGAACFGMGSITHVRTGDTKR